MQLGFKRKQEGGIIQQLQQRTRTQTTPLQLLLPPVMEGDDGGDDDYDHEGPPNGTVHIRTTKAFIVQDALRKKNNETRGKSNR